MRVRGVDTHQWQRVEGAMQLRCTECGRRWRPTDNPDHIGRCRPLRRAAPTGNPTEDDQR